jgi:hypothetical protein
MRVAKPFGLGALAVLLMLATPVAQAAASPCDCPRLSSQLAQLAAASDPAEFSALHALAYQDAGVLTLIELAADESDLVDAYGLTPQARYQQVLQAWVPVGQLCGLANDARVRSVDVPLPLQLN